jgi:sporulation protein YlmC with PRC-barrel domain
MRLSDEKLRKRTVIAADGQAIGEVAAIILDSESWRIEVLQVRLHKEAADKLGANRGIFHAGTLDLPVRLIQSVGDAIVLSVPTLALRELLPKVGDAA